MHGVNNKNKLRVFENRVLRKIFGHKRDQVTGVTETALRGASRFILLAK